MKVTIAICALLGVITRDEAVRAVSLHRLGNAGNVCINELSEDTNELLGLDNDYELVELENTNEPPEKIEADMAKADAAKHEKAEKEEHEAEAKAAADKKSGEEVKKMTDSAKKEANEIDKKASDEKDAKKKKDDEENGVTNDKPDPAPAEVSVTGYLAS